MFDAGRLARTFREVGASNLELLRGNQRIGVDALRAFVAHQIPDLTFREAFEVSGLRINITVSPREVHQQSRLLNAVTSPNVLIREAVLASCAVPGA
jgi:NTE family protein